MVNDLITRLLLDSKQFDSNLAKSTKEIQSFQQKTANVGKMCSNSFNSILGVVGKVAPALGVAVGGYEAFDRTIKANEGSIDEWGRVCQAAKASVDSFFIAVNSGNFDNFISGLSTIREAARDAYDAVDALGTTIAFQDIELSKLETRKLELQIQIKQGKGGKEELEQINKAIYDYATERAAKAQSAYMASLKSAIQNQTGGWYDSQLADYWSQWDNFKTLSRDQLAQEKKDIETRKKALGGQYDIALVNYKKFRNEIAKGMKYDDKTMQALNLVDAEREYEVKKAIVDQESKIVEAKQYQIKAEQAIQKSLQSQKESLRYLKDDTGSSTDSNKGQKAATKIETPIIGTSIKQLEGQLAVWKKAYENAGDDIGRAYAQKMIDSINNQISTAQTPGVKDLGDKINSDFANWSKNISEGNKELTTTNNTVKSTGDNIAVMNAMMDMMSTTMAATGENGAASFASILSAIIPVISAVGALAVAEGAEKGVKSSRNWIEAIVAVTTLVGTIIGVIASGKNKARYANGGIVESGSISGDMNTVRVNGGEMILNGSQQANLFRLINSGVIASDDVQHNVEFKIKGQELVGILSNYNKKTSRVM